jgi:hypothetical protein
MLLAAEFPVTYETLSGLVTIAWIVLILTVISLVRQPKGKSPSGHIATTGGSRVVRVNCSRCGRVVELPRENAGRQLFCPRCGSTLPRYV